MHELITLTGAAELRGVARPVVWNWLKSGKIHGLRVGHFWLLIKSEVENVKFTKRTRRAKQNEA